MTVSRKSTTCSPCLGPGENRSTGVEHMDPQTEWAHMKQHEGPGGDLQANAARRADPCWREEPGADGERAVSGPLGHGRLHQITASGKDQTVVASGSTGGNGHFKGDTCISSAGGGHSDPKGQSSASSLGGGGPAGSWRSRPTRPPPPRGGASLWCISATSPQGAGAFGGAIVGGTTVSQPPGHSLT